MRRSSRSMTNTTRMRPRWTVLSNTRPPLSTRQRNCHTYECTIAGLYKAFTGFPAVRRAPVKPTLATITKPHYKWIPKGRAVANRPGLYLQCQYLWDSSWNVSLSIFYIITIYELTTQFLYRSQGSTAYYAEDKSIVLTRQDVCAWLSSRSLKEKNKTKQLYYRERERFP